MDADRPSHLGSGPGGRAGVSPAHIWVLGVVAVLTLGLSAQSICSAVFGCGCEPIWHGLASGCRAMPGAPGVEDPCPWCAQALWLKALVFSTAVGIGMVGGLTSAMGGRLLLAYGATVSLVLMALVVAAILEGIVVGYPEGLFALWSP